MLLKISSHITRLADDASATFWHNMVMGNYGIDIKPDENVKGDLAWVYREIYNILHKMPTQLVIDCSVKSLQLKDLGKNRSYYPNHGFYVDDLVALNINIFYEPDSPIEDSHGHQMLRSYHTLGHEFGHSADQHWGTNGVDLSSQPAWMSLSGWSKEYRPGLEQLIIKEKGTPEVRGEMYFDPKAEFGRFYSKRNCFDDWADHFVLYVLGLKDKVPAKKRQYFDKLLNRYYKNN